MPAIAAAVRERHNNTSANRPSFGANAPFALSAASLDDWVDRGRARELRSFARQQGVTLASPEQRLRPWMAVGADILDPTARAKASPLQLSPFMRAPDSSRIATASSVHSLQPQQAFASGGSERPTRTASTTLGSVWRRALSTPTLGKLPSAEQLAALGMEGMESSASALDGALFDKDALGTDELQRLIAHVHGRVVEERSRRKHAEALGDHRRFV